MINSHKFLKLHRVVYDPREGQSIAAMWQRSYKDYLVDRWLERNCHCQYYHSPGYLQEKFIEFEDSNDAVMFALRWA